jgi:hypothetical protein
MKKNCPIKVGSQTIKVHIFKISSCGAVMTVYHAEDETMERIASEIKRISKNSVHATEVLKSLQKQKLKVYDIKVENDKAHSVR